MEAIERQARSRGELLEQVVARSASELSGSDLAAVLDEALRIEHAARPAASGSPRKRRELPGLAAAAERASGDPRAAEQLLRQLLEAYADEIGSRFDPRVYRAVVAAGRFGFNWMSHAASGGFERGRRAASGSSVWRWPFGLENLLPSRIQVTGEVTQLQRLAAQGTLLLVPTHQSHNDILMFGYLLDRLGLPPFAWGAGLNLFSSRLLGFLLRRAGAYTVDRENASAAYHAVLRSYSARIIEQGVHSLFFPGGGRCRSGAIEPDVRLGLLSSGLHAQRELLRAGHRRTGVYVIPVTVSYHQVLEAPWLIDEYLAGRGIAVAARRPGPTLADAWRLHWRSFAREDGAIVRVGAAMDVLGERVDGEGRSIASDGTPIDPADLLARLEAGARGESSTAELGRRVVECFHRNATVLPSQLVAYALFEALRARRPGIDLAAMLELPEDQRSLPRAELREAAASLLGRLQSKRARGELALSPLLEASPAEAWLADGIERLTEFHGPKLVADDGERVASRDLRLLYYYRNRLSGHGLSQHSPGRPPARGGVDREGFLV